MPAEREREPQLGSWKQSGQTTGDWIFPNLLPQPSPQSSPPTFSPDLLRNLPTSGEKNINY